MDAVTVGSETPSSGSIGLRPYVASAHLVNTCGIKTRVRSSPLCVRLRWNRGTYGHQYGQCNGRSYLANAHVEFPPPPANANAFHTIA